jgi:hypothetical protein
MKKLEAAILVSVVLYLALWALYIWSPTLMKPVLSGSGWGVGFITVMVLREKFGAGNAFLIAIPAIALHYALLIIGSRFVG